MKNGIIPSALILLLGLPLFVALHGWNEHPGSLTPADIARFTVLYFGIGSALTLAFYPFLKNRSVVMSTAVMMIQLFFGSAKDQCAATPWLRWLDRYSLLLILIVALLATLFFLLRRSPDTSRLGKYLSILLPALIALELVTAFLHPQKKDPWNLLPAIPNHLSDTVIKPDIFYIVPDEYTGSSALMSNWGYDNRDMDSFLVANGFTLVPEGRSNYDFTPFSMASTLNMEALPWLKNSERAGESDYLQCAMDIRDNRVVRILKGLGYAVRNHSIFEMEGPPPHGAASVIPMHGEILNEQTFTYRIINDLSFHLVQTPLETEWLRNKLVYSRKISNDTMLSLTSREARATCDSPRFVYTHLFLPHGPYFADATGRWRSYEELIRNDKSQDDSLYIGYMPKSNALLKELITDIIKGQKRPTAIILMSDHGYRQGNDMPSNGPQFRNYIAVRSPSGEKLPLADTLTNLNLFPLVLNKLFPLHLPLHKDTTIRVIDKVDLHAPMSGSKADRPNL